MARLSFKPTFVHVAAAIGRTINAVAPFGRITIVRFAGADPDHIRIRGRDRHRADREHRLLVENRIESDAVVARLEDAARAQPDIEDGRIARIDRDIRDAAAHHRRPDRARLDAFAKNIGQLHRRRRAERRSRTDSAEEEVGVATAAEAAKRSAPFPFPGPAAGGSEPANQTSKAKPDAERDKIAIQFLARFHLTARPRLQSMNPSRRFVSAHLRRSGRQRLVAFDDLLFRRELVGFAAENDPVRFLSQGIDQRFRVRA